MERRTTTKLQQLEEAMSTNVSTLENKIVKIDKGFAYLIGYLEGARSENQEGDY